MSQINVRKISASYLLASQALKRNAGQWAVYESSGNCVVLAGPGSGKTKTITLKLARILAEEIQVNRGVACVTYNTECTRELERRLETLGVRESRDVFIGTVHSFCLKHILVPYGHLTSFKLPSPIKVAGPNVQAQLFGAALTRAGVPPIRTPAAWRRLSDSYRRTYIDRDDPSWRRDAQLADIIEAYEGELRANGLVDFDDMPLLGLQLVEKNEWIRRLLKARFPVFVVDEYQDLGLPLHRIVLSLCFTAGVRLLAVGDPDQSIYGFVGAKPELLYELSKMPDVETVFLKLNYRCGKHIVSAAKIAIGEDRDFSAPDDAHVGTVEFHEYQAGLEEQAESICRQIVPESLERRAGRHLSDIAVLYLDKYDGDVISAKAAEVGLQFTRTDNNAPYRRSKLVRWLEDCAAWCSGGWRQGQPRLSSLIQEWLLYVGSSFPDDVKLLIRRGLVKFLWHHRSPEMPLHEWLHAFYLACLGDRLQEDQYADEQESFDNLLEVCDSGGVIEYFRVKDFAGQGGASDHLRLMTLHSAKGSEFDVVIMMGMEQGRLPRSNVGPLGEREARRLFYVGLTRARHEVHITYSGWFRAYGNIRADGPSKFITELVTRLAERDAIEAH